MVENGFEPDVPPGVPQQLMDLERDPPVYGEALVGVVHAQARSMGVDFLQAVTDTALEAGVGGGIDVRLTPSLGLDAGVGYRRSPLFGQRLSWMRLVSTIVWIM
jgi:hypothetical protein